MTRQTTRDRIEEQADILFYENGFEATSFADISAAVGISRGNFYHHFKYKDDILDAVIRRRLAKTKVMLENWETDAQPKMRILSFIRILLTNQTKIMAFGCPVGTLTTELAKLDHIAQPRAAEIFSLFRDWLTEQFRTLGRGEESKSLAIHLLGRTQGIAVIASAYRDESYLQTELATLEEWLRSIPDASLLKD